jgi:hypothetical protein
MTIVAVILWGSLGAVLAELVKQRQKWSALSEAKFRAQFKSLKFWATFLFLVGCGASASYFLYEDAGAGLSAFSCFGAGAGAQALIRSLGASAVTIQGSRFGFDTRAAASGKVSWRDILA